MGSSCRSFERRGIAMATKRRKQSSSGFYHVFHRGVNHFDIFETDEDREYYIHNLRKHARLLGVEVHAWCLMSNHIHLLLKSDFETLSAFMRRLSSSYAKFFNTRHVRCGPLFDGRFESVCVETDEQLMTVVRYIHRNPVYHEEAALCGNYRWSSFGEYVTGSPTVCDISFVIELFGDIDSFGSYHAGWEESERHLDVDTLGRMGDDEARRRADAALLAEGFKVAVRDIGKLPRKLRDEALTCIKRVVGCSLRQIQRLTAVAYSAIRKAVSPGLDDEVERMESDSPASSKAELRDSLISFSPERGGRAKRSRHSKTGFTTALPASSAGCVS